MASGSCRTFRIASAPDGVNAERPIGTVNIAGFRYSVPVDGATGRTVGSHHRDRAGATEAATGASRIARLLVPLLKHDHDTCCKPSASGDMGTTRRTWDARHARVSGHMEPPDIPGLRRTACSFGCWKRLSGTTRLPVWLVPFKWCQQTPVKPDNLRASVGVR